MNYPGMYVKHGEHGYSLDGIFAAYPKTIVDEVRGLKGVVKSREPYIARVEGNTAFPWRVMVIAKDDAELLCNDMVYKLATPAQFTDFLGLNRVKWLGTGGTTGISTTWISAQVSTMKLINTILTLPRNSVSNM